MEHEAESRLVAHAPEELTAATLRRLGEGLGKVVYASSHWVVKRERSQREILALIAIWKFVRRVEHLLPGEMGRRIFNHPSRQLRFTRLVLEGAMRVIPQSVWLSSHLGSMLHLYRVREERGEELAASRRLGESGLLPRTIEFPPVVVKVGGWPGLLTVSEATERVEATLHQRLAELAARQDFRAIETWLERFLELRQAGWRRGLFSVDAHLKNFGVTGERIVLLDPGGLTDDWAEIESRLSFEEVVSEPHIQLGLGSILGGRPEIAARFNARWRAMVNRHAVARHMSAAAGAGR